MGNNDNFYTKFGLDPSESSENLGILLAGRDAQFDQYGVDESAPERKEVLIAYGILSRQDSRALYDQAVVQQRPVTIHELEHLSNFGSWPTARQAATQQPSAIANPFAPAAAMPYTNLPAQQYAAANPYVPAADVAARPSAGVRIGMSLADGMLAGMGGAMLGAATDSIVGDFSIALFCLFLIFYWVGLESLTGATPMKHICGYKVRDVTTKQNLSLVQAAKRNWWRLINFVPGVGQIISFFAAIGYTFTISPSNGYQGAQDRLANAEVVKKQAP